MSNATIKYYSKNRLEHHYFECKTKKYRVSDLIEQSKKYDVFDLPLDGICLSATPWAYTERIGDIADHFVQANKTDLKYPIILDGYGYIADGWHRVVKALMLGNTTIKAIRLIEMPDDYEKVTPE